MRKWIIQVKKEMMNIRKYHQREKTIQKTVYDPAGISNEEIIDLSKKAVDEGLLNNRVVPLENQHKTIIQGQVDYEGKVLKFEAYQDSYTGVVENAWPVL
ncbi:MULTISPECIES: CdiA family toxin C-terminal domain-containing protein [unclassified Clostridium]|uniref:CdiA family toxin C-terminal domain-containing protein n=1 Tax=unclassified Clostridium TaxID=2614128 RepID=UPI0013F0BA85|nr:MULTISPECIES: CdiA family toxin C-terminal domain-containing protein [unclassified Clostridium]NFG62866.1 hypothetical protein [Clostridium botulinum]NFQ08750.1 hypothetical protein [Clostridium botulinum]